MGWRTTKIYHCTWNPDELDKEIECQIAVEMMMAGGITVSPDGEILA